MPEYAPGLPKKYRLGNLSDLPTDTLLTLIRQVHNARRAGKHTDLRIGSPSGMFSWAVPKDLPTAPGEKRLAIRQPLHTWAYNQFEGKIPSGYGAGTVTKAEESPVVIVKNTPNHIQFTRGNTKDAPLYDMIQTGNGNWLISMRKPDEPPVVKVIKKEHFKAIPLEQVADLIDAGASVTPKIDGAGMRLYLGDKGISAWGIRPNKEGGHPSYTDVIGSLRGVKVPDELKGTILRGELYGMKNGKPIHPTELTSILNSTLTNAIDKKQKNGINLLIAALAVNKNGVDDYTADVKSITDKLGLPFVHSVPAYTGEAAKKLVAAIKAGKYPLTREGVVIHQPGKRPLKSKVLSDYDVLIRDIFKADTDRGDMAGGFTYSYPDSDEIVGRVGTGFTDEMRKDMWQHPENYIGQTARVHSQEQLQSGALRAPGFLALKAD